MNTLNKFVVISLLAGVIACGTTEESDKTEVTSEQTEGTEETMDLSGMDEISLADYQMEGSIYIPNNKKPEIIATDWGSTEIRVGEYFGLEIIPSGISVLEYKEQLASDLVFTIEYLEESENLIVFKKSIEGSDIKPEHHFFMNLEANGELYEIKSLAEMSFTKPSIDKMVTASKTLKLN